MFDDGRLESLVEAQSARAAEEAELPAIEGAAKREVKSDVAVVLVTAAVEFVVTKLDPVFGPAMGAIVGARLVEVEARGVLWPVGIVEVNEVVIYLVLDIEKAVVEVKVVVSTAMAGRLNSRTPLERGLLNSLL